MKNFVIFVLFSVFVINCGSISSGESGSNSPIDAGPKQNPSKSTASSNNNTNFIPYPGTSAGNTNQTEALSEENISATRIDVRNIKPVKNTFPAADNSEILTELNEKGGLETRIFKSNPLLAKIERTTSGKAVSVRAYLKNGKILPVPVEKIRDFTKDSAADILKAIGMETSPAPNGQASEEDKIKQKNEKEAGTHETRSDAAKKP